MPRNIREFKAGLGYEKKSRRTWLGHKELMDIVMKMRKRMRFRRKGKGTRRKNGHPDQQGPGEGGGASPHQQESRTPQFKESIL